MLVVTDHLVDDEAQEFLGEVRVEVGSLGKAAQPRDLFALAAGIGGRQAGFGLVAPHRLRHLEALRQQEDERGIDVIDTLPILPERFVDHVFPPSRPKPGILIAGARPACKPRLPLATSGPRGRRVMTATVHPLHPAAPGAPAPSLDPLVALIASDMNQVNSVILDRMQSEVPLIPELAGHLIAGGGKRMRPMLTLASATLLGYPGTRHHKLAATVEFIHTATLLHDDVVDGSGMRRGRRTANIIWGNPASVLVGDFLFSRAFELMVEDGSLKVLRILSHASAVIAEGEVDQLTAQRRIETDEEQYLEIISAKTAALFAAACRVSPIVAEASEDAELALECYGKNLGIAFQLSDDVIDYASDTVTMGKGVGDDFRDGKMTLPVILAYARGNGDDRAFWRAAIGGERISDDDLALAIRLLNETDALADTIERARQYGRRAIDALAMFPASKAKAALTEAAEFAVARAY